MNLDEWQLNIEQTVVIQSSVEKVFEGLCRRLSVDSKMPDGSPMPMVLERWPGGRWFRDLEEDTGHLWGFVQVIKPPKVLEMFGPMFMSYPVAGHIQFQITPGESGTELKLHHRAIGQILEEHRAGVVPGWKKLLDDVQTTCESP